MRRLLPALAAHGRWVLVGGLVLGTVLPPLARLLAGWIVPLIALSLFLAALRLGPLSALPERRALPRTLLALLAGQLALPLLAAWLLSLAGWLDTPGGIGTVLVLAAAPITGAPGLAILCGASPAIAMRQLGLGTALLPLTALPVFQVLPVFPDLGTVATGIFRLLGIIALAGGLAGALRRLSPALTRPAAAPTLDGLITLTLGLVVIGLMSAVGPAVLSLSPDFLGLLALAFALHGVLAAAVWTATRGRLPAPDAAGLAIAASNRNLALFLAGLPPETLQDLLLFVGCFQIPMYLAPLTLPHLPGWPRAAASAEPRP